MAGYVLEHRTHKKMGQRNRLRWEVYVRCARREPLNRVFHGLGSTAEWRVRKTAATVSTIARAA